MEKEKKRFYKIGETIWIVAEKREGRIKSIDKETHEAIITVKEGKIIEEVTLKLWEIDKIKYKAKEKLAKANKYKKVEDLLHIVNKILHPKVKFAKVRDTATIPSKRKEDAGYDLYSNLDNFKRTISGKDVFEIECPVLKTTLVPTGLAVAMPSTHYFNLKHERGSTAVKAMSVLAGVVDSGFRNEMFIALTPLEKSVIITSEVDKVEENDTHILYPYSKAICQGTIDFVPEAIIEESTYEDLLKIESERKLTMLGQSGK